MKKIFFAMFFLGFSSIVFAQNLTVYSPESYTDLVTEIPNTMDVNSYSDLEFDNFFGFIGYGVGWPNFNLGASTYFGNVYTSLYFNGDFIAFENKKDKSTETQTDFTVTENGKENKTTSTNSIQLSSLIGFAGIGIKPTIVFRPGATVDNTSSSGNEKSTEENGDNYTYNNVNNNYSLLTQIDVGVDPHELGLASLGGVTLSPHVYFGIEFDPNVKKSEQEGFVSGSQTTIKTLNQDSVNYILFGLGSGIDLPEGEITKTSFNADFDFAFQKKKISSTNYKKIDGNEIVNASLTTKAKGDNHIGITLGWKTAITPNDKISIVLKGGIPFIFYNSNNEKSITVTDTLTSTTTETYADITSQKISRTFIYPNFGFNVSYKPKSIITFGTGATVNLPFFDISKVTTYNYDTLETDRKLLTETTVTTTSFKQNFNDFDLIWKSGFRVDISDAVILDCFWNIIGDLFSNFSQNTLQGKSFWDGMGALCFHNLSLQLAVKF